MDFEVVILAAGAGRRMRSDVPKVLHEVAGRPLLGWVLALASSLDPAPRAIHIVHSGDAMRARMEESLGPSPSGSTPLHWADQPRPLGTGDALARALPAIHEECVVLVLYGDVPALTAAPLTDLLAAAGPQRLALLTVVLERPDGYGRIRREAGTGRITGIVEERDATPDERAIREINTGVLAAPAAALRRWMGALANDNAQQEYYLTDVVGMAVADGLEVVAVNPSSPGEVLGINDRVELEMVERHLQRRRAEELMRAGATLRDASRVDVRGEVEVGDDVTIDVDVVFEGRVRLASGVSIGPFTLLRDTEVGEGAEVLSHSVLDGARVAPRARVGPFARLRPGADIGEAARVGNFVEIKASRLGSRSQANHLTYVGDAEVGDGVNIGAGTITCNYDGVAKHRTIIGDGAFIGSGVELVAPIRVGAGATVGAGSTVTRDAPAEQLTIARSRQQSYSRWQRPSASEKEENAPEDDGNDGGSGRA